MIKTYYRANLPHILPIGATFFVTFRLQGSLPFGFVEKLKAELDARILEIKASKWLDSNEEIYKQQKLFFKKGITIDPTLDDIWCLYSGWK